MRGRKHVEGRVFGAVIDMEHTVRWIEETTLRFTE